MIDIGWLVDIECWLILSDWMILDDLDISVMWYTVYEMNVWYDYLLW